jgi:hypothetical protein
MSTRTLRLTFRESIGSLCLRRYEHERHGVVETLTQDTVIYVRPVFGLLRPEVTNERRASEKKAVLGRNALTNDSVAPQSAALPLEPRKRLTRAAR